MTELILDNSLVEQLRQLARLENRSLDAVLRSMLEVYTAPLQPSDWPLVMARMAEAEQGIVWNEYAPDLSEHSREILEREFGDHLLKRMQDDDDDSA